MNAPKYIAIVAAMLITASGMAGIANYGNAGAATTQQRAASADLGTVQTLATIHVTPTAEQLRELRHR